MELTDSQKRKKEKGVCITPYCMKPSQKKSTKKGRGLKCFSCAQNVKRLNNPLRYSYHVLKNNAKRRGKKFTLTFERFTELAKEIDYMNKKGTRAKSMTIDRKREEEGYTDENVQGLTLKENIYKYKKHKQEQYTDVPF